MGKSKKQLVAETDPSDKIYSDVFRPVEFMTKDDGTWYPFAGAVLGVRGSGKTCKVISMCKAMRDKFRQVFIFKDSFDSDETWSSVKDAFPSVSIFSEYTIDDLIRIVKDQKELLASLPKGADRSKYHILIVLDDGGSEFLHHPLVGDIAIKGRHKLISFAGCAQEYTQLNKQMRNNMDFIMVHNLIDAPDSVKREIFKEQFGGITNDYETFNETVKKICMADNGTAAIVLLRGTPQRSRQSNLIVVPVKDEEGEIRMNPNQKMVTRFIKRSEATAQELKDCINKDYTLKFVYRYRIDPTIFTTKWRMNCHTSWWIQKHFAKTEEEIQAARAIIMSKKLEDLDRHFSGFDEKNNDANNNNNDHQNHVIDIEGLFDDDDDEDDHASKKKSKKVSAKRKAPAKRRANTRSSRLQSLGDDF